MSAKHTPGPWYVRKVNGPEHDPERFRPAVSKMGRSVPPTLGNALLIASAPDLLEALRVARDCILLDRTALADTHMNPVTNTVDDEDGAEGLAQYDAVLSVIDAAIAKATGAAS